MTTRTVTDAKRTRHCDGCGDGHQERHADGCNGWIQRGTQFQEIRDGIGGIYRVSLACDAQSKADAEQCRWNPECVWGEGHIGLCRDEEGVRL